MIYDEIVIVLLYLAVCMAFLGMIVLLFLYIPKNSQLTKLTNENAELRAKCSVCSNHAAVAELEKNYLASELGRRLLEERKNGTGRTKQASHRAEVFALFGDKSRGLGR